MLLPNNIANDNGDEPVAPPKLRVDSYSIEPFALPFAVYMSPAEAFLDEYNAELSSIFLQGNLQTINENVGIYVRHYGYERDTVEDINGMLRHIMKTTDNGAEIEEKCITALKPYFENNQQCAEQYFADAVLHNLCLQRIAMLSDKRLDGFDEYLPYGYTGYASPHYRQKELAENAGAITHLLTEYGIGKQQARQLTRGFDAATERSIAEYNGAMQGRG